MIDSPVRVISPRYLSEDERVRIADLHRAGHGVRAIAADVGRSAATVSRELRRNGDPATGAYRPFAAHRIAVARRARPRPGKLAGDRVLREFVQDKLIKRWSPEQIAHALPEQFPGDSGRHVVQETIYQAIYRPELGGLHRDLPRVLRTGRRRRLPHRSANARRHGPVADMTMIDQRPAGAAETQRGRALEGDLIIGVAHRSAIGTLVERVSRFTILLHVPDGRYTAEVIVPRVISAMGALPADLRRSLTWDQGCELAGHRQITRALDLPVFFCQKGSPWQRPSNENTNGLLRQYFPRGTDLRVHEAAHLAAVAAELNDRPRKTLGWQPPALVLQELAGAA